MAWPVRSCTTLAPLRGLLKCRWMSAPKATMTDPLAVLLRVSYAPAQPGGGPQSPNQNRLGSEMTEPRQRTNSRPGRRPTKSLAFARTSPPTVFKSTRSRGSRRSQISIARFAAAKPVPDPFRGAASEGHVEVEIRVSRFGQPSQESFGSLEVTHGPLHIH